jgi:hypothetical protein
LNFAIVKACAIIRGYCRWHASIGMLKALSQREAGAATAKAQGR